MTTFFDPTITPNPAFTARLRSEFIAQPNSSYTWFWYLLSSTSLAGIIFSLSQLYYFDYLYYLLNI